jgi:hypothetical protein
MILLKLAMTTPTGRSRVTYSPSRMIPNKEISPSEFAKKYAKHGRTLKVDMNRDGNIKDISAYSRGLDGWWIIESECR